VRERDRERERERERESESESERERAFMCVIVAKIECCAQMDVGGVFVVSFCTYVCVCVSVCVRESV